MKIEHNKRVPAVVEVVERVVYKEVPETFDIKGLTKEQFVALTVLVGHTTDYGELNFIQLYENMNKAIGHSNIASTVDRTKLVPSGSAITLRKVWINSAIVECENI